MRARCDPVVTSYAAAPTGFGRNWYDLAEPAPVKPRRTPITSPGKSSVRFTAFVALLLFPGTRVATAQSDSAAALGTLETMFTAMRVRDTTTIRSLFEPQARLVGIRTRPDGSQVIQAITVDQWVRAIGTDPRPDWTERAFNPGCPRRPPPSEAGQ